MATPTLVSVEKYLRASFDGPDREYVDAKSWRGTWARIRIVRPRSVSFNYFTNFGKRIPDVAIFHPHKPDELVPSRPPLIVIEIVSGEDRRTELIKKLSKFLSWGVKHVWLVDPWQRQLSVYATGGLTAASSLDLPEIDIQITPADIFEWPHCRNWSEPRTV